MTITIGKTTWKKSLLPFGNGTLFIALNEKVRKAENIKVGDKVIAIFSFISSEAPSSETSQIS